MSDQDDINGLFDDTPKPLPPEKAVRKLLPVTVRTTITLDSELHHRLKVQAAVSCQTMTAIIHDLLDKGVPQLK